MQIHCEFCGGEFSVGNADALCPTCMPAGKPREEEPTNIGPRYLHALGAFWTVCVAAAVVIANSDGIDNEAAAQIFVSLFVPGTIAVVAIVAVLRRGRRARND